MIVASAGGQSSGLLLALPILLLVLFYFVAIRPTQRQKKQVAEVQSAIEVGQEVMTGAGIFGTIKSIEGDQVAIEVSPGVELRVLRQTVVRVVDPNSPASPSDPGTDSGGSSGA